MNIQSFLNKIKQIDGIGEHLCGYYIGLYFTGYKDNIYKDILKSLNNIHQKHNITQVQYYDKLEQSSVNDTFSIQLAIYTSYNNLDYIKFKVNKLIEDYNRLFLKIYDKVENTVELDIEYVSVEDLIEDNINIDYVYETIKEEVRYRKRGVI